MCPNDHLENPTAPHKDNYAFWAKLEDILKRTDPERLKTLFYWKNTKVGVPEFPGYDVLRADLESRAREAEANWTDIEAYQESFRGRNEQGQEIWT